MIWNWIETTNICDHPNFSLVLERFSFECRKVIGFAFTTLRDWLKRLAPLFHPIGSKTKTKRDSLARVFPRFASATCNYFVFWLVHLIICVLCDWLEWLLWFWFYDTQLKTALIVESYHLHSYSMSIHFREVIVRYSSLVLESLFINCGLANHWSWTDMIITINNRKYNTIYLCRACEIVVVSIVWAHVFVVDKLTQTLRGA